LENAAETGGSNDGGGASQKAAQRSHPLFESPSAGGTLSYDISTPVRDLAVQSIEQARSAVSTFMESTRRVTQSSQVSTNNAQSPASAALSHALELSEQTTAAAFALARNIVRADNLYDVIQFQADYARTQFAVWQTEIELLIELPHITKRGPGI
jgi:hypothetical protein